MTTTKPIRLRYWRGVRYVAPNKPAPSSFARCGHCGRAWDDEKSTTWTPAPSGRCPFEYWHKGKQMKLKPIGSNVTQLTLVGPDGAEVTVLFSYQAPVACYIEGHGYFRTSHAWSRTTSKHVAQWLQRMGAFNVREQPQEFFDKLTAQGEQ